MFLLKQYRIKFLYCNRSVNKLVDRIAKKSQHCNTEKTFSIMNVCFFSCGKERETKSEERERETKENILTQLYIFEKPIK